jgi:hypothetical protein
MDVQFSKILKVPVHEVVSGIGKKALFGNGPGQGQKAAVFFRLRHRDLLLFTAQIGPQTA